MKTRFRAATIALSLLVAAAAAAVPACGRGDAPGDGDADAGTTAEETDERKELTMLHAEGTDVVNEEGETVALRGVNAGGLMVIEQWMTGFDSCSGDDGITCTDHKTVTRALAGRFGREETEELWELYREMWWSDEDFENCADMGMTVIRLPFTYMNVDFDAAFDYADAGNYDFSALDDFVERAAAHGMYTILDLHGAYGSQNGQDHSGEVVAAEDVNFFYDDYLMGLTVDLWRALSEHFRDNPFVAGYDILNEPAEKTATGGTLTTTTRHWEFYDECYRAIRGTGDGHIVIFESCWEAQNLPRPETYGWENCMYSFHHYTGTDDYDAHTASMTERITQVEGYGFGVPLYMGEFTCYGNPDSWESTLSALNNGGWSWTSWTYKLNATSASSWGIYYVDYSRIGNFSSQARAYKVRAHSDTVEEIERKWEYMSAEAGNYGKLTFSDGRTLYDIIAKYCSEEVRADADVPDGEYRVSLASDDAFTLAPGWKTGSYSALVARTGSDARITVENLSDGVKLYAGGTAQGVYTYDGGYIVGSVGGDAQRTRFRLVEADGRVAVISLYTGMYLRVDLETGYVHADASADDATLFVFGP